MKHLSCFVLFYSLQNVWDKQNLFWRSASQAFILCVTHVVYVKLYLCFYHSLLPHMRKASVSPSSPLTSRLTSWHPRSVRLRSLSLAQIYLLMKLYLTSQTHKIPMTLSIKAHSRKGKNAVHHPQWEMNNCWAIKALTADHSPGTVADVCVNLLCLQKTPKYHMTWPMQ